LEGVFLKTWDRFESYDPNKGRLFTWLVNVARNQAIDKTRSKEIIKDSKTSGIENSVGRIDDKEYIEQQVESIGIRELLNNLPEDQRFVVDYLYLRGYSQSELSEEFGIPLGTVKTRLRIAMKFLRSTLGIT
jgi:RNA polymerase sigma factor (sigma-70 family)